MSASSSCGDAREVVRVLLADRGGSDLTLVALPEAVGHINAGERIRASGAIALSADEAKFGLNEAGVVARSTGGSLADDLAAASALATFARKSAVSPVGVGGVNAVDDGLLALQELRIPVATRNAAFALTIVRARLASAVSVFEDALGANFAVGLVEILGADDFLAGGCPFASFLEVLASFSVLVVAGSFHTFLDVEAVGESPDTAIIEHALLFGGEVAELLHAVVLRSQNTFGIDLALGLFDLTLGREFESGVVAETFRLADASISPAAVLLLVAVEFVVVETALSSAGEGLGDGDPAH